MIDTPLAAVMRKLAWPYHLSFIVIPWWSTRSSQGGNLRLVGARRCAQAVHQAHCQHGVFGGESRGPVIQQRVGEVLHHQLVLVNGRDFDLGILVALPVPDFSWPVFGRRKAVFDDDPARAAANLVTILPERSQAAVEMPQHARWKDERASREFVGIAVVEMRETAPGDGFF